MITPKNFPYYNWYTDNRYKNQALEIPMGTQIVTAYGLGNATNYKVVIPSTCKYVACRAFDGMKNLKHVVIENPKTQFDRLAFFECRNLETVQIGNKTYRVTPNIQTPMLLIGEPWRQHGINVNKVRYIGEDKDYYYAYVGANNSVFESAEGAVKNVRASIMKKRTESLWQNFQTMRAADTMPKLDFTFQELYCIEHVRKGAFPCLGLSKPAAFNRMGMVPAFNCDQCQKMHLVVYQKCLERCGLEK